LWRSDGEAGNCVGGCELQDEYFPTAVYAIFSALERIVRVVLLVKARVMRILAVHLLFLSRFIMSSFPSVQISRFRKIMKIG
jgi:hypothetical protein